MKILIIGGVAAGTKVAAKLKRENRSDQVTIITKEKNISYAGCGLPYYIEGMIEEKTSLLVNTPNSFSLLTEVEVLTEIEATALDNEKKIVKAKNLKNNEEEIFSYDKLIIATGASPIMPNIPGINLPGVFKLRNPDDAEAIRNFAKQNAIKDVVIAGASFIGLEVADALNIQGLNVTVIDGRNQVLPDIIDIEMANFVKKNLLKHNVKVINNTLITGINGSNSITGVETETLSIPCQMVVMAVGIKANTGFLTDTGLELDSGKIVVDNKLQTNLPDVYAIGDCAMVTNRMTGTRKYSPMGSSANLQGRTLAQVINGKDVSYPGVLGTGVIRLPGLNVGRTGLGEDDAKALGYDVITTVAITDDKAHYYEDASFFITKLIADKTTHKLLGAQVIGTGNVDKMIDIAVTGINMDAKLEDFENGDYAYAPPFSTAIHPFVQAVYILLNKISGDFTSITPREYLEGKADNFTVIDASPQPKINGAHFVDLLKVKGEIPGIDKDEKLLLVCARGKRAYMLQNRLKYYGYTNTYVLEGSTIFNDVKVKNVKCNISADDVKRVKGLGFLRDKTTPDCFNGRVITRNGKITANESKVIAEAAKLFGNGEIAMTSRLTIEIQKIPYNNIEPLIEYLALYGLETGGTGSKVRPVVSCKGTTCQYGLIDTFKLSEEIHERFYKGYHDVLLPHKFKIAVGGCPNNCVKPDLNDLGIIGQRVPQINYEKCRGCKVCQVEKNCPIKVAKMVDGKIVVNPNECNHCGRCINTCPFGAFNEYINGYRVYIGGRWGKKVARGRYLDKIFTSEEEVLAIVEKAILLFREQGITGERFADTIERLGFEKVQEQLLSNELLDRKAENIGAQKHLKGGATC